MGRNRGSYLVSTLGPVAVAPLPPAFKITQIGCNTPSSLVEFKEGWNDGNCPIKQAHGGGTYISLFMKGENLNADLVESLIKGVFINQSETSIGYSVRAWVVGGDVIEADITPTGAISGTDSIVFLVNGVRSAMMPLRQS